MHCNIGLEGVKVIWQFIEHQDVFYLTREPAAYAADSLELMAERKNSVQGKYVVEIAESGYNGFSNHGPAFLNARESEKLCSNNQGTLLNWRESERVARCQGTVKRHSQLSKVKSEANQKLTSRQTCLTPPDHIMVHDVSGLWRVTLICDH